MTTLPPFSKSTSHKINQQLKDWTKQLNLLGAGLIALNLPAYKALYERQATVIDFIVLLLSLYIAVEALKFPELISHYKHNGNQKQRIYVEDLVSRKTVFLKIPLYNIGWVSFIGLMTWFSLRLVGLA